MKGSHERVGMATNIKRNGKKSVKEQLQSSLMNNSYIELSLLLFHGHGTMS